MAVARMIGALFLAGFLCYGAGFAMVTSAVAPGGTLEARSTLVAGALLMLLNVLVDVGKGVLFFDVLRRPGRGTALLYLTLLAAEAVLLGIGAVCLLLLVPLHERGADAAAGSLAMAANTLLYQVGEFLLGVAGVFLCALLGRARLVPRALAWWGVAGYALLAAGTVAELLGAPVGLALSIPGGLFEVALGIRLIARGFTRVPSLGAAAPLPLADQRVLVDQPR